MRDRVQYFSGYLGALQDVIGDVTEAARDDVMESVGKLTEQAVTDIIRETQIEDGKGKGT